MTTNNQRGNRLSMNCSHNAAQNDVSSTLFAVDPFVGLCAVAGFHDFHRDAWRNHLAGRPHLGPFLQMI